MRFRLNWREAQSTDRTALQDFDCAPEAPRDHRRRPLPHPCEWAARVNAGIHELKPPIGDGCLLLGEDDDGLAAVALVYWAGREGARYFVKAAAIAVELRRQGQGYGAEALETALETAADHGFGLGCSIVRVTGWVHVDNTRSRAVCSSARLAPDGDVPEEGYEEWSVELELPAEYVVDRR